jgi:hypothetical protein
MVVWCVEAATSCGVSCSTVAPASQQKQTHSYGVWYFFSYADTRKVLRSKANEGIRRRALP